MHYKKVYIDSIGYALPPAVVSSEELEERLAPLYDKLHIPAGQLEALTGVSERRWWHEGSKVSEGAIAAAKNALARSNVPPDEIGALLYTAVCREDFEPATACHVAASLDIREDASIYDLSNACLGVLNGIVDIANRIELGQIRAGLIVSCETAREIVENTIHRLLETRSMDVFVKGLATLTGGSGAVALVVSDGSFSTSQPRRRVLGGVAYNAPQHHNLCRWGLENGHGHWVTPFMSTDAASVLRYGLELGTRTWRGFLHTVGWSAEAVDKVICHQVGAAHQQAILKSLGISLEKDFPTYGFLGNMGTVSLPLTAALAEERGFLQPGDKVGFLGIGSGLNCLMLGVEW